METCKGKILYYALLWAIMLSSSTIYAYCNNSVEEAKNEKEVLVLQQADTDTRLLGTWKMQAVEYTVNGTSRSLNLENLQTLLRQRSISIKDLFLVLIFFENDMGLCSSSGVSPEFMNINDKGIYYVSGNQLVITLNREKPETFTINYTINGDIMTLNYDVAALGGMNFKFYVSLKKEVI